MRIDHDSINSHLTPDQDSNNLRAVTRALMRKNDLQLANLKVASPANPIPR
jgi:hypothetical protein